MTDVEVTVQGRGCELRARRFAVGADVREAMKRYLSATKPLDLNGDLALRADGRPVLLDIVAIGQLLGDAEDIAKERAALEQRRNDDRTNENISEI